MLKKLDSFAKGWKTYTTSATFVALTALFATKGVDLSLYIESVESVYLVLATAYAGLVSTYRKARGK